ncbi:hypothetical protein G6F70_002756 [Rhizopus microsporus]|nr:hypothetical protein G6F71_002647 [Rhizopus microsporus]KAG1201888.1 hypothetical protein G6F70_002756 [Rhizopus microsporus]KAG1213708.1 hypothetical protein G6F69_002587 [Rhizopus microsporus]KAG1235806.1 hypothetical protein G6F67_002472 [Rhizopus microsporus]KAG1263606.1 hypothetical protein G6F68_005011 [Rhizopus microsporus]
MLAQPPATALPPTGRRKSIRPISMEGSMTDTSSLTRNTASSLAKIVIKSPSPSPQPLANKSKRRVISRKPSLNNFKVDSKYLQDVSQKRRSSWAPSSVPAIEKKPSLESPELTHSIAPKQQSIEALHHHECDQLRRHICAGCDRNVIVNTDIQSSTAHKQKKESANSNNSSTTTTTTTATDDHPSSPIPTSTKEKLIQEEDEEERWKQSFLKQQEKILRTLLSNHHHINDYELMKLQSQVLQLKNHTNTTMDHILDMQTNILTKLTLVLNDPSPSQPPNAPASPLVPSSFSSPPLLLSSPLALNSDESMIEQEKAPDWQTKLEYDLARFKWSLNQWFGNIVGTGSIENKDYNRFGYTENVVISGICVTTEPGLLPKNKKNGYQTQINVNFHFIWMMNIKIDKYRNDAKWSLDYFKEDITAEVVDMSFVTNIVVIKWHSSLARMDKNVVNGVVYVMAVSMRG